jgi:hypothetical protein
VSTGEIIANDVVLGNSLAWGIGPAWVRPHSGSQTITAEPSMYIGVGAVVVILLIILLVLIL